MKSVLSDVLHRPQGEANIPPDLEIELLEAQIDVPMPVVGNIAVETWRQVRRQLLAAATSDSERF